jgi:hypothetical protein
MLQIIALFIICNAPVAIWRFMDCRLTHSPEILPLLVAAQELRRRKASLVIFPGGAREDAAGSRSLNGLSGALCENGHVCAHNTVHKHTHTNTHIHTHKHTQVA